MKKRKCLTFLFCLILCYSLFQYTARAQSSQSSLHISSQGKITYPPTVPNLAVIPGGWSSLSPTIQYSNIHYPDTSNEHTAGVASVRIEASSQWPTIADESDSNWHSIKPGDHIVATIWIKVSAGTTYEQGRQFDGARLGIDMYAHTSVGYGVLDGPGSLGNYPIGVNPDVWHPLGIVRFGTQGWVQKGWDFIVPSDYFTTVWTGATGTTTCNPVQIDSFVLWMQLCQETGDTAPTTQAWFADAALYINP